MGREEMAMTRLHQRRFPVGGPTWGAGLLLTRALWAFTFLVCCALTGAQEAIPPAPSQPFAPTTAAECTAFNTAYQKVMDKLNEAKNQCAGQPSHFDTVAAPMSCIQGGWANGKATVMRACARIEDQWCRAVGDREKKFAACMGQVEENQKKKKLAEDLLFGKDKTKKAVVEGTLLGPKSDPEKGASDDEIDLAFKAIKLGAKPATGKENKVVSKIQDAGLGVISSLEKDAFSELDNAFKEADFAELTRAEQPRPSPPAAVIREHSTDTPSAPVSLESHRLAGTRWEYRERVNVVFDAVYALHLFPDGTTVGSMTQYRRDNQQPFGGTGEVRGTWRGVPDSQEIILDESRCMASGGKLTCKGEGGAITYRRK
jgi:hypothetical protein